MVFILNLLRKEPLTLQFRLEQHRKEFDLVIRQLRVPEIEDQVDSSLLAIVPGFMIKRVVEDNALVLLQVLGLITNPHPSTLRSDEG